MFMQKPFVHIEEIVSNHWKSYGRNYYSRYDYEGVATAAANSVMSHLRASFATLPGTRFGNFTVRGLLVSLYLLVVFV
jgi:phosphoglucomutase